MRVLLLSLVIGSVYSVQTKTRAAIAKPCTDDMRGNGVCDLECAYAENDGGDCTRDTVCAMWAGDHWCDSLCLDEKYDWDSGDCNECPDGWTGDGFCDISCNDSVTHDGGDCEECNPDWIGDDFCDPECMTEASNYDNGDCFFEFTI